MALIKCSECGHEVSDKASACPNCGCPIEKGLICNECGNSVSPSDKSCPKCGNPIKSKNGFNWKKPILFLVILLFGLGGTYGVWYLIEGNGEQGGDVEITAELSEAVHRYDVVSSFHEGLSAVCKNDKWGYINSKGEEVIPCKYAGACDFSEGLACVYLEGDDMPIAFIDKKNNIVIDGFFGDSAQGGGGYFPIIFKDGSCMVYDKERHDLWINRKGQKVDEPQHSESENVAQTGYQTFYENGKCGVKDSLGNVKIEAKYSYIDDFSEGVARAYLYCGDEKSVYGFIDKLGNTTFSQSDFEKLLAYEKQQQEEQQAEEARRIAAMKPDWIQGTWVYSSSYGTSKVVISDDNIAVYMDGNLVYNGSYVIEDGHLVYNRHNGMSDYIILDRNSQRLMADETTYFNRASSSNNSFSSYGNSNVDNRIQRLERKAQDDINELNAMVSSGRMHPVTLMYIKQNLPDELSELMNYYRNQGNSSKYEEYAYKRRVVVQVLREIGI